MYKIILLFLALSVHSWGDEYDFDMDAIEKKPYEYSGYLRLEEKAQRLNPDNDTQNHIHNEALFEASYNYDIFKFKTSFMGTYDYISNKLSDREGVVNELYAEVKLNSNHTLLAGKESLKWGKGYFANPVAFFDREKDPAQPTLAREGYLLAKYSYNKSFERELKNLSFDFVYLPSGSGINKEYPPQNTPGKKASNLAARLYLLLYDTDIDFIYNYSDRANEKIGADISKNIQTNFEIHAEYAKVMSGGYDYLFGIRYLTDYELTVISEYIYSSDGLDEEQIQSTNSVLPLIAKDYLITLLTQKEPFDILYFSLYFKNITNLQDNSMQNKIGAAYSFKNNIETDLSYNKNSGADLSEFDKKQISEFLWLRVTWSF